MRHIPRPWIRFIAAFGAAISFGAPLAVAQPSGGPPAATVVVDAVRFEPIEQWREVTGNLRALRRALLASQEQGLVIEFTLQEGDAVEAGHVIARLHDARARLEVDRATADLDASKAVVAQREADAERAGRDMTRMDEMIARGAGNEKERDDARTIVKTAGARLEEARAMKAAAESALALARQRLDDMTIAAPFAGTVVSKQTEVGEWIERGGAIAEIVALDHLEARLNVPERYVDRIATPGQVVQVRVGAAADTVPGSVIAVIPDADPLSRLFPVRIAVANSEGRLRPGMGVVGFVPTGTVEPTLTVHKDAVLRDDAGEFVYYNNGGTAAIARISRMFAVANRVAVRPGMLQPGMAVVVEGNERLFPSQPLSVGATGAPGGGGTR